MDILSSYLPHDRRAALARGETIPVRMNGAALFADIYGFTPLTERLTDILGTRRIIEETQTDTQTMLGKSRFSEIWNEGTQMLLEDAIRLAQAPF